MQQLLSAILIGEMTKIYPLEIQGKEWEASASTKATSWTVLKKSSMSFFGTDGFLLYDGEERLTFHVDSYSRRNKFLLGELLLMDVFGMPLFRLRPKAFGMNDEWRGYIGGEGSESAAHVFGKRRRSLVQKKGEQSVVVFMRKGEKFADFRKEGCFRKGCCRIMGQEEKLLARISPKKASRSSMVLGEDIFLLCVEDDISTELIMAFIVVLDRIC